MIDHVTVRIRTDVTGFRVGTMTLAGSPSSTRHGEGRQVGSRCESWSSEHGRSGRSSGRYRQGSRRLSTADGCRTDHSVDRASYAAVATCREASCCGHASGRLLACCHGDGRDPCELLRRAQGAAASICATRYGVRTPVVETGSDDRDFERRRRDRGDFAFSPTCTLDVPRGSVTLVVRNVGGEVHNVSISHAASSTATSPSAPRCD